MTETICANVKEDTCTSVEHDQEADLRPGDDICLLCMCRECERCGDLIDLDCENRVSDGQGFVDVCDGCQTDEDKPYDEDGEIAYPGKPISTLDDVIEWLTQVAEHCNFFHLDDEATDIWPDEFGKQMEQRRLEVWAIGDPWELIEVNDTLRELWEPMA
tara:strand:+ start:278 stop:754 length:477 start_codon:yes stop_codon:yes gene_type:complete